MNETGYAFDCQKCAHNALKGNPDRIRCEAINHGKHLIYAGDDDRLHCGEYEEGTGQKLMLEDGA